MTEASLTDVKTALERNEKDKAMHRTSARAFFNLLDELYPPRNDEEYWQNATDRLVQVYRENGKPPLLMHLLVAMMDYLEEAAKADDEGGKQNE